jgi:hypothetical protein
MTLQEKLEKLLAQNQKRCGRCENIINTNHTCGKEKLPEILKLIREEVERLPVNHFLDAQEFIKKENVLDLLK